MTQVLAKSVATQPQRPYRTNSGPRFGKQTIEPEPFNQPDSFSVTPPNQLLQHPIQNRLSGSWLATEDKDFVNFHRVDETLLRGAMPTRDDQFELLKKRHNVGTIIDLRGGDTTMPTYVAYAQKLARQQGIRYVHIPLDSRIPPTQQELNTFFSAVAQAKADGKRVYMHCKMGIDRTGVLVAAHDVSRGISQPDAFKTMQRHGYNMIHEWQRPLQKAFVLSPELPGMVATAIQAAAIEPSSASARLSQVG